MPHLVARSATLRRPSSRSAWRMLKDRLIFIYHMTVSADRGGRRRRTMARRRGIDRRAFLRVTGAGALGLLAGAGELSPLLERPGAAEASGARAQRGGT